MSKKYPDFLKPEEKLQARLVSWIKDHPILRHKILVHIPAAQMRTEYEKYKWTALGCRPDFPDLIFLEPESGFTGLCLELKVSSPWRRDGSCKFPAQQEMLERLKERGYNVGFYWKYEDAKEIISKYFDL